MALGNLGITYWHYARLKYDLSHRDCINNIAYRYLRKSLAVDEGLTSEASSIFIYYIEMYDKRYIEAVLEPPLSMPKLSFDNAEEEKYRLGALKNHLFINPLNDMYLNEMCFASDVLHLPSRMIPN